MDLKENDMKMLHLLADGHTNDEIAEMLFLSSSATEAMRLKLIKRFEVKNIASLMYHVIKSGIIE